MTPEDILAHPARVLVRGKPARIAHHDPRGCEIPPDWAGGYSGPWAHQAGARENTAARARGGD
jgi:hypothetical protein